MGAKAAKVNWEPIAGELVGSPLTTTDKVIVLKMGNSFRVFNPFGGQETHGDLKGAYDAVAQEGAKGGELVTLTNIGAGTFTSPGMGTAMAGSMSGYIEVDFPLRMIFQTPQEAGPRDVAIASIPLSAKTSIKFGFISKIKVQSQGEDGMMPMVADYAAQGWRLNAVFFNPNMQTSGGFMSRTTDLFFDMYFSRPKDNVVPGRYTYACVFFEYTMSVSMRGDVKCDLNLQALVTPLLQEGYVPIAVIPIPSQVQQGMTTFKCTACVYLEKDSQNTKQPKVAFIRQEAKMKMKMKAMGMGGCDCSLEGDLDGTIQGMASKGWRCCSVFQRPESKRGGMYSQVIALDLCFSRLE